jgi:hypothetical protein
MGGGPVTPRISDVRRAVTLIVSIIALATSALASDAGSVVVVANNGIDSASCGSQTSPCRSISQGIENATDGDTLVVHPGLYGDLDGDGDLSGPGEEHFNSAEGCAVCITKRLTIVSQRGTPITIINIPRIKSATFPPPRQIAVEIAASGVTFGAKNAGFTISGDNDIGIFVDQVGNVRVAGNLVLNAPLLFEPLAGSLSVSDNSAIGRGTQGQGGFGVSFTGPVAERFEVTSVIVQNNVAVGTGFFIDGDNAQIIGNLVSNSQGDGFDLIGAGLVVKHNSAINNGIGFTVGAAEPGPPNQIIGNRAIGNLGPGILVSNSVAPVEVHENDIYGNDVAGFEFPGIAPRRFNCGLFRFANAIDGSILQPVNATNNYWGSPKGPGPDPADNVGFAAGCDVSNKTSFTPFATTAFGLGAL